MSNSLGRITPVSHASQTMLARRVVSRHSLQHSNKVKIRQFPSNPKETTICRQTIDCQGPPMKVPHKLLTQCNVVMAIFHLSLMAATLGLGRLDLKVPTYKTVLRFLRYDGNGSGEYTSGDSTILSKRGWELVPMYSKSLDIFVTATTAAFFGLSATFHLLNATVLRSFYLYELEHCRTPLRWLEYSITAPLMIVLIAYTLGVRERTLLLCIATLVATTMPFGYWVEETARPCSESVWSLPLCTRLRPWVLGHIPQVVAWVVILIHFYDSHIQGDERAPWFVHLILWGELVLFFSFGSASIVAQCGKPHNFYLGELCFQILSLISKGLLGLILLTNVLMLSRFEEIFD